ncbi:DUF3999 family protein [Aquimarina sp. 2201CG5-10]|uniref:DUF3999 family protein n=1 Tax=Aquimarina callyspongiae TaxID=3098150 RepID=UPI002AB4B0A3|nr:DUF3999 family protein [Aquimarina sp. 2201CG5-10]MDY8137796.1 DUF3999 family protein [Aquimarina sp. 2201CG5-10]
MIKKININFNSFKIVTHVCFLFLISSYSYGQLTEYSFKRELQQITDQWHSVQLPEEIFGKISPDLSDIRVYGLTDQKDTIEAPYLLKQKKEKVFNKNVQFKTLNKVYNQKGTYVTLEVPTKESVNRINLDFKQSNFDWPLTLQGSQDQKEWYTIVDNYRVLSITNDLTNYRFTTLKFQDVQYQYLRLWIKTSDKPILNSALVTLNDTQNANYLDSKITHFNTKQNKDLKQTILDIDLDIPTSVSYLKLNIKDSIDYYRPLTIHYVVDSIKTAEGWKPRYSTLASGVLSSLENQEFKFNSTILKTIRVIIHNHDNEPLVINKTQVKGYKHELITRFTNPATYYLTYGNEKANKPRYDLNYLTSKIPKTLKDVSVGEEQVIKKIKEDSQEALFKNKLWLWAVMLIIIILLGWFTLMMLKKK